MHTVSTPPYVFGLWRPDTEGVLWDTPINPLVETRSFRFNIKEMLNGSFEFRPQSTSTRIPPTGLGTNITPAFRGLWVRLIMPSSSMRSTCSRTVARCSGFCLLIGSDSVGWSPASVNELHYVLGCCCLPQNNHYGKPKRFSSRSGDLIL
jgi:hypothetical protein